VAQPKAPIMQIANTIQDFRFIDYFCLRRLVYEMDLFDIVARDTPLSIPVAHGRDRFHGELFVLKRRLELKNNVLTVRGARESGRVFLVLERSIDGFP
jgi:hypothetical protein